MNYFTQIINPPEYLHSKCFIEVARAMDEALNALGAYDPKGTPIIFGAHLTKTLPKNAIIFNAEQVFSWDYLQTLKNHKVWDYSTNNIKELAKHDISAELCPVSYMPSMTCLPKAPEEDIDVLMYGSMNERRKEIVDQLRKIHVNVVSAFNVYGNERDNLISRSKIILNVHYYPEAIFEIFRCSHIIANKKFLISEIGNDRELEEPFYSTVMFSKYEDLTTRCVNVLHDSYDPLMRHHMAESSFENYSKTSMVNSLKDLIG